MVMEIQPGCQHLRKERGHSCLWDPRHIRGGHPGISVTIEEVGPAPGVMYFSRRFQSPGKGSLWNAGGRRPDRRQRAEGRGAAEWGVAEGVAQLRGCGKAEGRG